MLIKGVSGVGKSELAREIGRWLVERSRVAASCAWFAPLVGAHSDAEMRIAVALAMGVSPESMPTDAGAANDWLAAQLPRRSLLVLDEAENAIEHGGRAVRDLLERLVQAPNRPLIIVTAQKDVGSRALPVFEVRRMEMDAAVRLFAACAGLQPGGLVRLQHAELAEALDFMDRLPRAIELLAAVWRDRRDPDLTGLLAEMRRHRDRILRDPKYPDEVKSVTLGVQLGYDRLQQRSLDAAALFADLSLFPGGLNAAGATAIYGAGGPALLRMIEDQSLLERTADDLFYLPTPFRYFAERQVAGGAAAAQARLGQPALAYYAGWATTLDDGLVGGGAAMGAIIARFLTELPSIETWAAWGVTQPGATAGSAARLVTSLRNLYDVSGLLRLRRDLLTRALGAAQRALDRGGEANVQKALGDLALREDDLGEARRRYESALAIYPQIGARLGEANVQKALGDLALREADLGEARRRYESALAIYPQIGDRLGEANVQKALGDLALREADLGEARRRYESALAIYPQIGDRLGEANVQQALGDLALREADLGEARRRYESALAIYPQIGARLGEANVLQALGDLALREADLGEARRRYESALAIYPQIGARLGEATVLQALGDLALREADLGEARRRYESALAIYPQIGDRLGEANVLQALGDLALREADLGEARRRYESALAIYPQIGDRLGEANVLQALGDLALREADLGEARRRYESALAIYPQIGARLGEANVQKALGDLALREDDLGEARVRYAAALAIYPQIRRPAGGKNVQKALGDLALREELIWGRARRRYESALAIYPQIGARLGEANVLRRRWVIWRCARTDLGEARRRYESALAILPANRRPAGGSERRR